MKLFLCSSFITEKLKPDFDAFVGNEFTRPKVACITTAFLGYKELCKQRGEDADFSWFDYELAVASDMLGWEVDSIDLRDPTNDLSILNSYAGLWVMGGLMLPLIEAFHKTRFSSFIQTYLQKHTFYVGTSAGSMVCSKSLDAAEWYIGEPEPGVTEYEGLGLIDFQIYPHYDESNLVAIKSARLPSEEYWLLKDGQAVAIYDGKSTVFGGEITLLHKQ